MAVVITGARVELEDGTVVAGIERIVIGGGERTRTIDGVPETTTDPQWVKFHVRLLSQAGPMIADELLLAETWEEACAAGEAYAARVVANAEQIAELKAALK
jgi:hypothetical protein